jgi:hypothetical protein
MVAVSEGIGKQGEPKLPDVEVAVNADEIIDGIKHALIGNPVVSSLLAERQLEGKSGPNFEFENRGNLINVNVLTFFTNSRKSIDVFVRHAPSADPKLPRVSKLTVSRWQNSGQKTHTGSIRTDIDGVVSTNTRIAVQNAQRFIGLLS